MAEKIRKMPIYEAWERAANNVYHRTLGALEFIASAKSTETEEVKRFAAKMLADMQAKYEQEMARLRERYEIVEYNGPDEDVVHG